MDKASTAMDELEQLAKLEYKPGYYEKLSKENQIKSPGFLKVKHVLDESETSCSDKSGSRCLDKRESSCSDKRASNNLDKSFEELLDLAFCQLISESLESRYKTAFRYKKESSCLDKNDTNFLDKIDSSCSG